MGLYYVHAYVHMYVHTLKEEKVMYDVNAEETNEFCRFSGGYCDPLNTFFIEMVCEVLWVILVPGMCEI